MYRRSLLSTVFFDPASLSHYILFQPNDTLLSLKRLHVAQSYERVDVRDTMTYFYAHARCAFSFPRASSARLETNERIRRLVLSLSLEPDRKCKWIGIVVNQTRGKGEEVGETARDMYGCCRNGFWSPSMKVKRPSGKSSPHAYGRH